MERRGGGGGWGGGGGGGEGGGGARALGVGLSMSQDVEELCLAGSCPPALVLASWELTPGFLLQVLHLPPAPLELLI